MDIQLVSTGRVCGAQRTLLELATFLRDQVSERGIVALEADGAGELICCAQERSLLAERAERHRRTSDESNRRAAATARDNRGMRSVSQINPPRPDAYRTPERLLNGSWGECLTPRGAGTS